ncbi:MAG: hypothetical protein IID15_02670 [Candidatus Marinimicrobia bacterium]|nr:hypothetical protein [Candidatus Neomarinimicrobiota bacterium]
MPNVTATTAANFIPELWRDAILDYAERTFRLKNQVTDLSSELANGGDILHIPRVDEETASSKSAGSAITYGANTDEKIDLAIDQHFYSAKLIEDVVRVQESANLFNMYARSMGYALGKKVENYIATIIQSATANDVTLTTDNAPTASELRTGIRKLMDIGVDPTSPSIDVYLYASPAAYLNILGLDQFVSWEKIGPGKASGNVTGILGEVYGIPTYQSIDWASVGTTGEETASLFTSESVLYASELLRVQSDYSIDDLGTKVVADVLFGAVLTQSAADAAGQIANFNNP